MNQKTKRQLNPFAFPAETDALFRFLMVAALAIAVNQSVIFLNVYEVFSETPAAVIELSAKNLTSAVQTAPQTAQTSKNLHLNKMFAALLFIFVVFAAAFFHYRAHPQRLIEKSGLVPLPTEKNAAFAGEIRQFSQSVGIESAVEIVIKEDLRSKDAQAFGTRRLFFLKFDKGWLIERIRNPAAFRAVALHELAHIFNRDVALSYFAKSLWTAFYRLTMIPFIAVIAILLAQGIHARLTAAQTTSFAEWIGYKIFYLGMSCVQISGVLLVFVFVRAKLLRVREYYADFRAAMWGERDALVKSLEEQAALEKQLSPRFWQKLWRNHPSAFERLKVIKEPHRLFRLTPDLPFITGILLAFLLNAVFFIVIPAMLLLGSGSEFLTTKLLNLYAAQNSDAIIELIILILWLTIALFSIIVAVCGFLLSYLIVRTLVLQLLREAVQVSIKWRTTNFAFLRCLQTAALVTVGCEIGFLITPFAMSAPQSLNALIRFLLWLPVTTFLIWLVLIYARFFGARLFEAHLGSAVSHWKLRLHLFAVNALLIGPILTHALAVFTIMEITEAARQILMQALIFIAVGSVFLIAAAFAASWLILNLWRFVKRTRCPNCGAPLASEHFPGDFCGNCGKLLAEWLFTEI